MVGEKYLQEGGNGLIPGLMQEMYRIILDILFSRKQGNYQRLLGFVKRAKRQTSKNND